MEHSVINDLAICIVAAWMLAIVAQILRQPLILAYLAAGFALGPGLGVVKNAASMSTISSIGLLLLLFMIGLEIDLKRVLGAGRLILAASAMQILGGCLLGVLFFRACGFSLGGGGFDALYLAVGASLSSTVIIVKILYEKRDLDTVPGRITLGIMVLQDLFAILFLAVQPNLDHAGAGVLVLSLGRVVVLVVVAFAASRYALPPLFRSVARLPELVLVGALAWCFLIAGLAGALGLSSEMGALVAGVAISTFPYTLEIAAKVTSLRDFFVTLFFVSLGMQIPVPTLSALGWAGGISLFIILTRFVTVFPTLYKLRQGYRASLLPTVNLCQVSELSLVIMSLGVGFGHVSRDAQAMMAYTFVVLAVVSSYGITYNHRLVSWFGPLFNLMGMLDLDREPAARPRGARDGSIYLLGFSWTASSLLEEITRRTPTLLSELTVIDFNPNVIRELKTRGVQVIYGDITQRETLLHAGIAEARVVVCSLPNTVLKGANNLRLTQQLRELNPTALLIMHAELFNDVEKLYAAGADYVSVPRLIEAQDLQVVLNAARQNLLREKRAILDQELAGRREVIP